MSVQADTEKKLEIETFSQIGKKSNNEDYVLVCNLDSNRKLFLVCDGLGGHPSGEIASKLTCQALQSYFSKNNSDCIKYENIIEGLKWAQKDIEMYEGLHSESKGMKSTLAGIFADQYGLKIVWIGDSRVYHIRDGNILFQTVDHSYGNYLRYNLGASKEDIMHHPRKNKITRVIGSESELLPEIVDVKEILAGDFFLVCSDGLLEQIDCTFIKNNFKKNTYIKKLSLNILDSCQDKTNDNYSMILLKVIQSKRISS
jgi:PPM family protein phosphatase